MGASWAEQLISRYAKRGHPICVGFDPQLPRIPLVGSPRQCLESFFLPIVDALAATAAPPAAIKPNIAYFAQYGLPGLQALERILAAVRASVDCAVVLDAKRGDIGPTALAYAREAFDAWGADALTVAPYLGADSVGTILDHAAGRGVYVLVRTSNPSAGDLQNLPIQMPAGVAAQPLFEAVACWLHQRFPHAGAVVGATDPNALRAAAELLRGNPLLVPGVGSQGGTVGQVFDAIEHSEHATLLINASSSVLYAYEAVAEPQRYAEHAAAAFTSLVAQWREAQAAVA